jgi:kumamolisin
MTDNPKGYQALANSERNMVPGASRSGPASPGEKLTVSVRLRKRSDGPALPDMNALAATSYRQRKHMSREEFATSYGAAESDLNKVAEFARSRGLSVVESSGPRRTVVLSGTVAQINAAFAVDMKRYYTGTETYRSYEGKVSVPDEIADIVESVHGFDNRQIARPMFRAAATGQATTPLTPPQVAKLYNFPTNTAAGETIAILEFGGGYIASDISSYFTNTVNLPVPTVTSVGVDGATNSFTGGGADIEVILDIDVAGSVAPGAKIVVYFAPNTLQGWIDAITTAVHDTTNRPSVISISWAGGESGWGSGIQDVSAAFQEAAVVGVTVFVS